jgi:hypothetical protein
VTDKTPSISGRLVRSSLRYLREREGAATIAAVAAQLPQHGFLRAAHIDDGWIPLPDWLEALALFEARFGDPPTLRLLREMTRATMAAAVSTVWGTFLASATPDQLMARVGDFWSVSFDTGTLVVAERSHGRAKLAVEGWDSPPSQVGAIVAEACAVFLARVGVGSPRVVAQLVNRRLEIDGAW